jgi:hypothetical protein
MARVMQSDLWHVEILDGRVPHGGQRRGVVELAGLVTDHVAQARVCLAQRELLRSWRAFAAASSLTRASGRGSTRPAESVFGSSWSNARSPTSTRVLPICTVRRPRSTSPQRKPAISPRRKPPRGEVPGMPVAILRDAAENGTHLIGGECLELSSLTRNAIDQSGNVSR